MAASAGPAVGPPPSPRIWFAYGARVLGVALAYVVTAKAGLALSVAHGNATPVWAPTGISLAVLVLFGRRMWPAVTLGALLANLTTPISPLAAAGIAAGNTAEALVGATLLLRIDFRPSLDRVRDVIGLVVAAALMSTLVSATVGASALFLSGSMPSSMYWTHWEIWWVGDMMGDLLVAPVLLVWIGDWAHRPRGRALEALALAGATIATTLIVFGDGRWSYAFILLPLLLWATLRFRQHGATLVVSSISAIALARLLGGSRPLEPIDLTLAVQIFQALMGVTGISLLVLAATISERARAESAEERLRTMIKSAPAGVLAADESGTIAFANDALGAMFGYEPSALVGRSVDTLVPAASRGHHEALRSTFFAAPTSRPMGEGRDLLGLREDGSSFPVEIGLGYLPAGSGIVAIAIVSDVTERAAAQAETQHALEREHEAVLRLHALDELKTTFLHAVSHDLRTPLTSILGLAVTLEREDLSIPLDEQREFAHRIATKARKLDRLLSDLLDLDRLDRGVIEPKRFPTDVGSMVREIVADAEIGDRPVHVHAARVMASIDGAKVERIVDNLLANAVRHTPTGTDIWIDVRKSNGGVMITVEDAGDGVPKDAREVIFEPFEDGGRGSHEPGLGIGLSLVARFAALHGGRAWVEERHGGGASFRVFLPGGPVEARAP